MASTNPVVRGKRVTFTRRFFGDSMLESVLQIVTLFIGWLIWFAIVAPGGQTPAKQLLNVYIIDHKSGRLASTRQVWMREIGDKYVAVLLLGSYTRSPAAPGSCSTPIAAPCGICFPGPPLSMRRWRML